MTNQRKLIHILLAGILMAMLVASVATPASAHGGKDNGGLDAHTRFFTPKPVDGALKQVIKLIAHRNPADAKLIAEMLATPQAVWFTGGTPKEVKQDVKKTVKLAAAQHKVPVLVAYNIPFRDCSQFSAGGATSVAEYEAWIDGFAAGIGNEKAVVILEPDGLGIIPWYHPFGTKDLEWCQPAEADPAAAAADRFAMMNYAVDKLKSYPHAMVYLDGTHSGWLGVGDAADRLIQAGVTRADGFYLNISNYQYSTNLVYYGTWISQCIANTDPSTRTNFDGCANQYWNGGPHPAKIADLLGEWTGVALSNYGEWSETTDVPELNVSGYSYRFGSAAPATHFIIDTSRNGQGPWQPPSGYPDAQDWCNPPGRGLGLRPTASTGNDLLDAYLWVKIPGASDGECTRGLGPSGTTVDPEWGLIDPAAGAWFPEMALDLVHNAVPPLP